MIFTTILPRFLPLLAISQVLDVASGLPFNDASLTSPISDLVKRESNENCAPDKPFMERHVTVGKMDHGTKFCAAKWQKGVFPNKIEAKATEDDLCYLKIGFTDGSEMELGESVKDDGHRRFGTVSWDPWSDTFSKFSLYDGGWKGALGRIVLETTNKCGGDDRCRLDAGGYWDDPPAEKAIPRGGDNEGMLLGFAGSDGDIIDALRPIFSNSRPEKVRLTDATFSPSFEQLNEKPFSERQMKAVHNSYVLENPRKSEEVELGLDLYLMTEERTAMTVSHEGGNEMAWDLGGTVGGELSFQVGLPYIGDADVKGVFLPEGKYTKTNFNKTIETKADTDVERVRHRYGLKTKVKAGGKVKCTVIAMQSDVTLRYKATLELIFEDGGSFKYPVQGEFKNSIASDAVSRCEDMDLNGDKGQESGNFEQSDTPVPGKSNQASDPEKMGKTALAPSTGSTPVIQQSGTYCSDGTRAGDLGMSDEALDKACKD